MLEHEAAAPAVQAPGDEFQCYVTRRTLDGRSGALVGVLMGCSVGKRNAAAPAEVEVVGRRLLGRYGRHAKWRPRPGQANYHGR